MRFLKWSAAGIIFAAVMIFSGGYPASAQTVAYDAETEEEKEAQPRLLQEALYLMAGEPAVPLSAVSGSAIGFVSSDPSVASVTAGGLVSPGTPGTAVITVQMAGEQGGVYAQDCPVSVIDPVLAAEEITILLNRDNTASLALEGIPEGVSLLPYAAVCSVDDASVAAVRVDGYGKAIAVCAKAPGKTRLTVTIRGRSLVCRILVKGYEFNKSSLLLSRGQAKTLKVRGTGAAVTFSSADPRIASVTKDGTVRAKGIGNTVISAVLDGFTLRCPVSVADSRAIQAVAGAKSVLGAVYSQEKRMQKGFYDCSSLVWRSYSPGGVTFGSRYWAPTAADEAYWCVRNKKVLYHKGIKNTKRELLPGDLIFYTRGDNGRYKNICHVAMFAGYEAENYMCGRENGIYGVILEADGMTVSMSDYLYDYGGGKEIVLIARPVQ